MYTSEPSFLKKGSTLKEKILFSRRQHKFRRGGSNEYLQFMFLNRNKKTPLNPSFTILKRGLRGSTLYRYVIVMNNKKLSPCTKMAEMYPVCHVSLNGILLATIVVFVLPMATFFSPVKIFYTKGNNDMVTKGDRFIQHCYSLYIFYLIRKFCSYAVLNGYVGIRTFLVRQSET